MRKVHREQQAQLVEDRTAQRDQSFLLALAEDAQHPSLSVEVANLDAAQLVTA
jgi:hypothetical protein